MNSLTRMYRKPARENKAGNPEHCLYQGDSYEMKLQSDKLKWKRGGGGGGRSLIIKYDYVDKIALTIILRLSSTSSFFSSG